jgi:hypothetical protein
VAKGMKKMKKVARFVKRFTEQPKDSTFIKELKAEEAHEKKMDSIEQRSAGRMVRIISTIADAIVKTVPVFAAADEKVGNLRNALLMGLAEKAPEVAMRLIAAEEKLGEIGLHVESKADELVAGVLRHAGEQFVRFAEVTRLDLTVLGSKYLDLQAAKSVAAAEAQDAFNQKFDTLTEKMESLSEKMEEGRRWAQSAKDSAESAREKLANLEESIEAGSH